MMIKNRKKLVTAAAVVFAMILGAILPIVIAMPQEAAAAESYGLVAGLTTSTDVIDYTRKEDSDFFIGYPLPLFYGTAGCAPVAGSCVVAYYDRTFVNLIPNYTPFGPDVNYNLTYHMNQTITNTQLLLANLMDTTSGGLTTVAGSKDGMRGFVNGQGYYIDINSYMNSSGVIDFATCTAAAQAGYPGIVFVTHMTFISKFFCITNKDTLTVHTGNANHAMFVFGTRSVRYFRNETYQVWSPTFSNPFRMITVTEEVNFRTDFYLRVSDGTGVDGYINITNTSTVADGYSVRVYN